MGMNSVIRSLGGMPYFPFIRGLNGYWSHGVLQTNKDDPELAKAAENMQPYLAQAFPRRMLMSEDETATYGQYMADIETRVKEMMTNFVMGRESLDKFDEYVDGLYSMGLDKCWKSARLNMTATGASKYHFYCETSLLFLLQPFRRYCEKPKRRSHFLSYIWR